MTAMQYVLFLLRASARPFLIHQCSSNAYLPPLQYCTIVQCMFHVAHCTFPTLFEISVTSTKRNVITVPFPSRPRWATFKRRLSRSAGRRFVTCRIQMPRWKRVFQNVNNTFSGVVHCWSWGLRYLGEGGGYYTCDLIEAIYYSHQRMSTDPTE